MKKRSNTRCKILQGGATLFAQGEFDAMNNRGCLGGKYRGHLKKCYMNGYRHGQAYRANSKN